MPHRRLSRRAALAGHLVLGSAAAAAPGDPRRVAAERVSLEAAPAGDAAVRRRLRRGEGLLGREGGWCAVRVARAGEEGSGSPATWSSASHGARRM